MKTPPFSISAVERDVGLSKDVLRVWERRYGFPLPGRDANGERVYPAEQVQRLRLIRRLMDQGHRPGRLLGMPAAELAALPAARPSAQPSVPALVQGPGEAQAAQDAQEDLSRLVELVQEHRSEDYLQALQQRLARQGLRRFVQDTVAPLTVLIGTAWADGHLQIFEEHVFTELTSRTLRQAIAAVPGGRAPRVLLTTLPNEPHGMGLLMVEALLSLEGAHCLSLGTQTPLLDVVQAAQAHRADAVALSFSTAFPARQILGLLQQLRTALPTTTQLWAGGGVRRLAAPQGALVLATLDDAEAAVRSWRGSAPSSAN